jgi:cell shape-determining protein MreC
MEVRALAAESAIRDLQSDMVASTELIKALADQLAQFAKYIEASRLQFEAIENQNDLLCKRVEADNELLKSLEAQNAQLAKDLEVGRLRTNRLIGKCIAIGLLAIAGLAIAVRTAME